MGSIRYHGLPAFFQDAAEIFAEKEEELCKTDIEMGDEDLGLTMEEGFGILPRLIRESGGDGNIGKTLMKASMKISGLASSTMGTLMVSGIIEGAEVPDGKAKMGPKKFSEFLDSFARGIECRGKRRPGDRTLLDVVGAAAKKALEANKDGVDMVTVIHVTMEGARAGAAATKDMLPKFDKTVVFSVRVKGTPDQGTVVGQYLLEGMKRHFLS